MKLLIDIGNSRIKWAWSKRRTLERPGQSDYTQENISEVLDSILADGLKPGALLVSNVAGSAVGDVLCEWAAKLELDPFFLKAGREAYGVTNAYTDETCLGVDRWAALIAVTNTVNRPACIVDSGTATTIDALSASGEHLGGLILPGLEMMRKALLMETQGVDQVTGAGASLLARDTGSGVAVGTMYALVSSIDRIAADIHDELGQKLDLILTGGDGQALLPLLSEAWQYHPNLVLEGLAVVGEKLQ